MLQGGAKALEMNKAIVDDIGYDATGKKITNNDLDLIGEELKKFIAKV